MILAGDLLQHTDLSHALPPTVFERLEFNVASEDAIGNDIVFASVRHWDRIVKLEHDQFGSLL